MLWVVIKTTNEQYIHGRLWLRGRAVVLQPEGRQFEPQYSLGKMLNPDLSLIEQKSAANRCTVWMCVWMGEFTVKSVEWSSRLEKRYVNTKPLTIYIFQYIHTSLSCLYQTAPRALTPTEVVHL